MKTVRQEIIQVFGIIGIVVVDMFQEVNQPALPSHRHRADSVLPEVVVHFKPAVQVVAGQFVVHLIGVIDRLTYASLGQDFRVFADHPFLEGNHDGIGKTGTELRSLFKGEGFLIGTSFHGIQQTNLLQRILRPGLVFRLGLGKFSSAMCPASRW